MYATEAVDHRRTHTACPAVSTNPSTDVVERTCVCNQYRWTNKELLSRASSTRLPRARTQTVGGGAAFVAVLALSQALQGFVLRVSCSSPLGLPTALGERQFPIHAALFVRCLFPVADRGGDNS